MKKLICLLLITLTIQGMEEQREQTPAQRLLEEIKRGTDAKEKSTALNFVNGEIAESSFLELITWKRAAEKEPRIAELSKAITQHETVIRTNDSNLETLTRSIDTLLAARASLTFRERWRFWLPNSYKEAIKSVEYQDRSYSCYVREILRNKKDITPAQVEQIIQHIQKVNPSIRSCLSKCLYRANLEYINNNAAFQGLIQAGLITARDLYNQLPYPMATTFLKDCPDVVNQQDLIDLSSEIDTKICHKEHGCCHLFPTAKQHSLSKEELRAIEASRITKAIDNITALREAVYAGLQQKEKHGAVLKPLGALLHRYILSSRDISVAITQIPWFLSKQECDVNWFDNQEGNNATTSLDLLLNKHRTNSVVENIKLLLSHTARCKQDHQKELETEVNRLGRHGHQYDGIVTDEERAAAKETQEYRQAVELLASVYPNSELPPILARRKMII